VLSAVEAAGEAAEASGVASAIASSPAAIAVVHQYGRSEPINLRTSNQAESSA
jgi:hypothetical protein